MTRTLPIIVRIGRPPIATFDPPRCGMDRVEITITTLGVVLLPVAVVATVAVVGYLPGFLAWCAAALRGL